MAIMLRSLALLIFGIAAFGQTKTHPDAAYYPLRMGKSWTYRVQHLNGSDHSTSRVTWRVTHHDAKRNVYQVWPKPMLADDEAMQLRTTDEGIEEIETKVYVLKFPLIKGAAWSHNDGPRRFTILTANSPCHVGTGRFPKCVVVEETDDSLNLRIVTTYAHQVGPVKFEYFRRKSGREMLVQTLELEATP